MKTTIVLTSAAQRKVEAEGAGERIAGIVLGEWLQKGDFVEIAGNGDAMVFIIRARRVRIQANGQQTLIFELDHPPRPAVR